MNWIKCSDRMPKPNVSVIAFVPAYGGGDKGRVIRAQYASPKTLEQSYDSECGEYDDETDTYYCAEGWYETNEYEDVHWYVSDRVTHWIPLPDAPSE